MKMFMLTVLPYKTKKWSTQVRRTGQDWNEFVCELENGNQPGLPDGIFAYQIYLPNLVSFRGL
jgi:hypothetical protein